MDICLKCSEKQWSVMDKNYLKIHGHCWNCDKREWEANQLSTEEFERREKEALNKK